MKKIIMLDNLSKILSENADLVVNNKKSVIQRNNRGFFKLGSSSKEKATCLFCFINLRV